MTRTAAKMDSSVTAGLRGTDAAPPIMRNPRAGRTKDFCYFFSTHHGNQLGSSMHAR